MPPEYNIPLSHEENQHIIKGTDYHVNREMKYRTTERVRVITVTSILPPSDIGFSQGAENKCVNVKKHNILPSKKNIFSSKN